MNLFIYYDFPEIYTYTPYTHRKSWRGSEMIDKDLSYFIMEADKLPSVRMSHKLETLKN